ncbi:deoxyribonuclease IV [Desulfopila inferna]|uniref:deoxyribonuclease IV n=1 Tax=Desulfopila inferna TaxID=468528 RepID=UPI001962FA15|nr:deoxyribonuclease IV [Desulfopila inferna]MBM9604210.1 deoxyribonuclease IV [Desulfopila inferna]
MPFLGAHESVSGGLYLAFERLAQVGGEALQIFTRNQRQWIPAELRRQEVEDFRAAWRDYPGLEVASHGSYLVNLASADESLLHKSIGAFVLELERCQQLGITMLVLHPGSHGGTGVEQGIEHFVRGLDAALEQARSETRVLIENTAGQGTGLGSSFEEIAAILAQSGYSSRLGVCLDTCHLFAAGYDIRTVEAYQRTMALFDERVGVERIEFFHLNDSTKEVGSRVDRHAHIGEGQIGLEGFRNLLNDPRFAERSMTLETPKDKELENDRRNLRILAGLLEK